MLRMKTAVIILCVFAVAGCATLLKEEVRYAGNDLRETVERFYSHKMNAEYLKAFQYENRSLSAEVDPQVYVSKSGAGTPIYVFEILEIGEEGSARKGYTPVKIRITTDWPRHLGIPVPEGKRVYETEDVWTKKDGRWYRIEQGISKDW